MNTVRVNNGIECDYNGCQSPATHTDGEWIMCPEHDSSAYRSNRAWMPILRVEAVDNSPVPHSLVHYLNLKQYHTRYIFHFSTLIV